MRRPRICAAALGQDGSFALQMWRRTAGGLRGTDTPLNPINLRGLLPLRRVPRSYRKVPRTYRKVPRAY